MTSWRSATACGFFRIYNPVFLFRVEGANAMPTFRNQLPLILLGIACFFAIVLGGGTWPDGKPVVDGASALILAVADGGTLPFTTHSCIAILVLIAALISLAKRKAPLKMSATQIVLGAAFAALLVLSIVPSVQKAHTLDCLGEWMVYGVTMIAAVVVLETTLHVLTLLGFVLAGMTYLSGVGILEYVHAHDAGHRIMVGWPPNTLAGLLMSGFFIGIGLTAAVRGPWRILTVVSTLTVLFSFLLAQSKGAFLALAIGLFYLAAVIAALRYKEELIARLSKGSVVLIGCAAVGIGIWSQSSVHTEATPLPAASSTGLLSRLTSPGQDAAQSVEFRKLLFHTSMDLIVAKPLGRGLDTYYLESARPGLVTPTANSHNIFLQLAVEAGVAAPFVFLFLVGTAMGRPPAKSKAFPESMRLLTLCIQASVISTLVQGLSESNFYVFGAGIIVSGLLGVLIALNPPTRTPSVSVPRITRFALGLSVAAIACVMVHGSWSEVLKSQCSMQEIVGDRPRSAELTRQLLRIDGFDGMAWMMAAQAAPSKQEAEQDLRHAVGLEPSHPNFEQLAQCLASQGKLSEAIRTLDEGLNRAPNDMGILLTKMQLQFPSNKQAVEETGRRLLAVENTTYFQVRSLPDFVPTETFEARMMLADIAPDQRTQVKFLSEAIDGYNRYLKRTWPMARQSPYLEVAGQSSERGYLALSFASNAAHRWMDLAKRSGDPSGLAEATSAARRFDDALNER